MHTPPQFEPVRVVDAWDETPLLRGVRFDLDRRAPLYTLPGRGVKGRAPGGGEGSFGLPTRPGETPAEIRGKRGHPVADKLIDDALEGAAIGVREPMGRGFPVEPMQGRDV